MDKVKFGLIRDRCNATGYEGDIRLGFICARNDAKALLAEVERLRAVIAKLPKCWRLDEQGELVQDVPRGASALIALARVAHREGDRPLEQSARDRLARDYGMSVNFKCVESVDQELRRAKERP